MTKRLEQAKEVLDDCEDVVVSASEFFGDKANRDWDDYVSVAVQFYEGIGSVMDEMGSTMDLLPPIIKMVSQVLKTEDDE